jgi:hypothetical protein
MILQPQEEIASSQVPSAEQKKETYIVNTKCGLPKLVLDGMLKAAFLGFILLAGSASAQQGPSGYHLIKTVKLAGAGGWDYLAIDSESRRLFVSRDSHVVVLNAETGDVVGDIAGTHGVHGVAIAGDSGRGFTSNGRTNNVTIFDLKRSNRSARFPQAKNRTLSFTIRLRIASSR